MEIDETRLRRAVADIRSWDEWEVLAERFFRPALVEKSNEEFTACMRRPDEVVAGSTWHATCGGYRDTHALHLLEKSRWMVFSRLEPEADRVNRNHPEWYGRICYRCERWTRDNSLVTCPWCGGDLLDFALNEDK